MIESRITDPQMVSAQDVQAILGEGQSPTIQFSTRGYSTKMLQSVNRLSVEFGARLEVRFYGHYADTFDAAILEHLPDVKWLSVDCLESIRNEDRLHALTSLERLSFGVHRFDRPEFLAGFPLENLTELSLSENAKRNLDLAPLRRCAKLAELFVQGHTKHIDALTALPLLQILRLSGMPNRQSLAFVEDVVGLRSLTILLGSRSSIDELAHPTLQELRIVWVRGLESLGSLERFPALRVLHVEDQARLRSISAVGPVLRELSVHNCKNLERIIGLETQSQLEHFRTSRTKLDLEALLAREWPGSMRVVGLFSGSLKWNEKARKILAERGYRDSIH